MARRLPHNVGELDAFVRGWASALLVLVAFVAYFAIPPLEIARIVTLTFLALSVPLGLTAKARFSPLYWLARLSTHRAVSSPWDPRTASKRRTKEARA